MAGVNSTTLNPVFKEWYHGQRVNDLCFHTRPLLDLMPKEPGGGGKGDIIPTRIAQPNGFANAFSDAQTNDSGSTYKTFTLTYGYLYGVISFTDRALKEGAKDAHAFLKVKKDETDAMLNTQGNILAYQLWGNGGGAIGRRSSASTNVITLTNPQDVHNFEVGMSVSASSGDGSGAADALRTGSTTVASVDRSAGTVTLTSAAAINSFANNDYLFRKGIFSGDVTQVSIMKGIQAWVPASAPSAAESFFGVDRSVDDRLSGFRSAVTGQGVEGLLRETAAQHYARFDGQAEDGFLHPEYWERLARILQNQGVRLIDQKNERGNFGYKAIEQTCPYGTIKWKADRFCPVTTAFFLNLKKWKLQSISPLVHWMNEDGQMILRKGSAADYEMRSVSYGQPATNEPSGNARVTLPAL